MPVNKEKQLPSHAKTGWDKALEFLDNTTALFNIAGTALIVGLMVLIGADVFGRTAFNIPIAGVPEIVSLSIVAIVFLQVPQALRSGRFTRSDALLKWVWRSKPRLALGMELLFDTIAILTLLALLYAAWPLFIKDWDANTFVGAVGDFTAPVWPVKLIMVIGTGLLIAQFLGRVFKLVTAKNVGDGE